MLDVYVDADGCPVKEEVYRVARRCGLAVTLVANRRIARPPDASIRLVVVGEAFDAADDWIADHAKEDDIVVTADVPLAARCLEKGARVVGVRGDFFSRESIGDAIASRDLMSHLRDAGVTTGGPAPFVPRDRSRFLQALDEVVQAVRLGKPAR
jgi:uncharacterized protein YaiI (UPF0178 family)